MYFLANQLLVEVSKKKNAPILYLTNKEARIRARLNTMQKLSWGVIIWMKIYILIDFATDKDPTLQTRHLKETQDKCRGVYRVTIPVRRRGVAHYTIFAICTCWLSRLVGIRIPHGYCVAGGQI